MEMNSPGEPKDFADRDQDAEASPEVSAQPAQPQILAVDDQPDSLRLLQIRLETGGMKCHAFADGAAALEWLEDHAVDAIILDVMMPHMDGYEVCRRIKSNPKVKDVPVIFLTAKLESADKVRGLEIGGHDYLSKPVQQQELLARTRAAVRVKQLQDELKEKLKLQNEVHALHRGMLSQHWMKTLGQLAASLAHEINNPLAAALGNVQLLRMRPGLEDEIKRPLEVVDQSLQRAGHKLRSLLLIAQVGHHPQEIELHHLLQDLVTVVNFNAVMNKVTITTSLDSTCRWAGIPGELARALLYILNNAIEAVQGIQEPHVQISLEKTDSGSSITVADNGIGVDEDIKNRIFEPFFTTKSPHQGVGLHLALQIIRKAGGSITVNSPEHGWSTLVRINLPGCGS